MGSYYYFDAERALTLFRATGRFTENDLINLLRAAYDDPRHTPHFNHIWDARAVDELAVDVDAISMYRDLLDEYEGRITREKVAVVAVRALTRIFTSMLMEVGAEHPATFRLFDDREAAAAWVGVPASAVTEVPDRRWTEV